MTQIILFMLLALFMGGIGIMLDLHMSRFEREVLRYLPVLTEGFDRARDEIIYNLEEIRRLDGTIMTRIIELQNESFAALVDMHQSSMDRLMARNLTEYELLKEKGLVNPGGRMARKSDNTKRKLEKERMTEDGNQETREEEDQND